MSKRVVFHMEGENNSVALDGVNEAQCSDITKALDAPTVRFMHIHMHHIRKSVSIPVSRITMVAFEDQP